MQNRLTTAVKESQKTLLFAQRGDDFLKTVQDHVDRINNITRRSLLGAFGSSDRVTITNLVS